MPNAAFEAISYVMSNRSTIPELTPALLLRAYASGVFPMAEDAEAEGIHWIDPDLRGIIPLDRFHAPRSLLKRVRRGYFHVTIDTDFDAVLNGCADREATWINAEIRRLYIGLFRMGYAHSIETRLNGVLVGGLYGVKLGGAFFGESMFSSARDASKVALVHLVARMKAGGFQLLDTQFVTDHLTTFGAHSISRKEYRERLDQALNTPADFYALAPDATGQDVAQLSTQTS